MPRIYLPKKETPPQVGDLFIVKKVFHSTGPLMEPVWDVWVEPISKDDIIKEDQKKNPWRRP